MHIATWNIQGARNKMEEVVKEMERMKIDIAALTETKKKGHGATRQGAYIHVFSGVPKEQRAKRGVSLIIHKRLKRFITNWENVDERIIKLNMKVHGTRITIIGVYALNDVAPDHEKDEFFEKLNSVITDIGNSREIIVLGDLNGRTGRKKGNAVVGEHGEDTINDNGTRLIDICEHNYLKILNGYYQHKDIHKYTWIEEARQRKSIIDYIIIKQKSKIIVQDVRVYRGATCGSDHYLLRANMIFPYANKFNNRCEERGDKTNDNNKITKYNIESLENESTQFLYKRRLDDKLNSMSFNNIEEQYEKMIKCIHEAAKEAIGEKIKQKRKDTPYWWNEDIEKEITQKRDLYLRYLQTKDLQDKINYKHAQAKVRKMIIKEKNNTWEQMCNRINTYIGGRKCTEAWKTIKRLRKNSDKILISAITPTEWENHFQDLLTENRPNFKTTEINPNVNVQGSPITINIEVIKKAVKQLKHNKSPGPSNIPAELLIYGTETLYSNITYLFNQYINGAEIPQELKMAYITTIHKKGAKDQCTNYRGLSVTSTFSRLYGRIIRDKLEQEYTHMEEEEQAGFRSGRSTIDNIFCLSQLIDKKIAVNQEVHLLFIDLSKAYDNIPITKLWEALEQTGISITIIKAIKNLYKGSISKIKIGNKISSGFEVTKGLRQGCCISPSLFKIYIQQTLKMWKRKCAGMGIPMENDTLYSLQFADDQVILAQDYEDLQYMTRKLIEEYSKWGLEINITKTKYMNIGGIQQNLELEGNLQIEIVDEYKYLGFKIKNDGRFDAEINQRNTYGRQTISRINSILWDKTITNRKKSYIYNTIVKSIVTYGSEVWQINEKNKRKLLATEMDFWRRSARISRLEHIRNERIREIMKAPTTIIDEIRTKQLIWFGHVQRMNQERLPKKIIDWRPPGRRKRGRPRRSWRDGINEVLEERDIEQGVWNDRERWRREIGRRRQTL